MTPAEMAYDCAKTINAGGSRISFIKPAKMPKGFPKGEFLSETPRGKIYSYDAERVLAFLVANGVVQIATSTKGAQ